MRQSHISLFLFALFFLTGTGAILAQTESDGEYPVDEEYEEYNMYSFGPKFSRPSSGVGLGFGFNFTDLKPSTLDPDLDGDFIPTTVDAYAMIKGLLLGVSWTSTTLYDPGDLYDEFSFGYTGFMAGYDHSLFYGKMTMRVSLMLGGGELVMIKKRPDISSNPILNPTGREILEEVRNQEFFILRPAFGIGYSPIDFIQFRGEVGFMYPTSDDKVGDLREPVYGFQIVFGTNR